MLLYYPFTLLLLLLAGDVAVAQAPAQTNYAPVLGACPSSTGSTGQLRDASTQKLSAGESDYVSRHRSATQQAWKDWLKTAAPGPDMNAPGGLKSVDSYLNKIDNVPKVGLALSGGSFRATMFGSGFVQGLDGRNDTAKARGTAGLLQLASHIAGLSGGSWATGSLAMSSWQTVQTLHDEVWRLEKGLLNPPDDTPLNTLQRNITADARAKLGAGAAISLIDVWGRHLASHLINETYPDFGQRALWTDIKSTSAFTSASYPFPIITTLTHQNGSPGSGGSGTIIELNPYEVGTYDKNVAAFVPTEIFGTRLNNGSPQGQCVYGLQNAGYFMGLSSAIFNQAQQALPSQIGSAVAGSLFGFAGDLTAQISNTFPQIFNPFKGFKTGPLQSPDNITLVDGGEDGQGIPLAPLLAPARGLDFIIALDSNADSAGWPVGGSLVATYNRFTSLSSTFGKVPIPKIPDSNTIVRQGLNARPTFFGCNSKTDVVNGDQGTAPIIAYFANYPWTYLANFTDTTITIPLNQSQGAIDNGFAAATAGGAPNWATCLACASLQRSFERSKTSQPDVCKQCFSIYCWNGDVGNTRQNVTNYAPEIGTPAYVTTNAPTITRTNNNNAATTVSPSVFMHMGALISTIFALFVSTM